MDQDEPQKHKSSTDAKQIGGPSYSERSKVKRTSYSDHDSSRAQSQQPPLKRQTRTRYDAKQAEESVGINNATHGADPINTNTEYEYTSAETALQIDLVLESLFSYMNWSDLLSCRVVNKKWQYEATNELRRRKLIIKFNFHCREATFRKTTEFQNPCRVIRECRTPSLLSSFQVVTSFLDEWGPRGFSSILTTIGSQMKHLTMLVDCRSNRSTHQRSSLMTDLQNIFVRQIPNLEFLKIKFDLPSDWKEVLQTLDSCDQPQNDNNQFKLLPNLKTFIVTGTPPPMFVRDVINAAVNLNSLGGVFTCEFSALIKYFMQDEGRDRIHLLKYLRFNLAMASQVETNEFGTYLLETFLAEHKNNLKLETLECVFESVRLTVSPTPRIVNAFNQLLEISSETLQKLRIEPERWFFDLLVIPCLPKLQEICFNCLWSSSDGLRGDYYFPRGFNMNYSFPNVSSIVFLKCNVSLLRRFVHSIEVTEPVPSVRHIVMVNADKNCFYVLASDLRHVFPQLVSISYCEEYYPYEI